MILKGSIYSPNLERLHVERGTHGAYHVRQKKRLWAVCHDEETANAIKSAVNGSFLMMEVGMKPEEFVTILMERQKERTTPNGTEPDADGLD